VADPGYLSRIPDPVFYPSRIPDLGSKNINFTKFNYFIFEMLKKKIWANFQRIIELFTQKIVSKLSKIWVWDPGSGKNLFRIPESKRHRIPDPDPQHCTPHPPYVTKYSHGF
jgi:hypothetical protein